MIAQRPALLLVRGLALFWLVFILLDYLYRHPYFIRYLKYFDYGWFLLLLFGLYWLILSGFRKGWKLGRLPELKLNGMGAYLAFTVLTSVLFIYPAWRSGTLTTDILSSFLSFLSYQFSVHMAVFLVLAVAFVLGDVAISFLLENRHFFSRKLISITVGLFLLSLILLLLGSFFLLNPLWTWLTLLVILLLGWRRLFAFLRWSLLVTHDISGISRISWLPLFVLMIFLALNAVNLLRPVPIGWDSLTVYMNLARLTGESGSLVSGEIAHAWSLIMSLGFVLFDSSTVALNISFAGGVLSIFALYQLSERFLPPSWSLLVVTLMYTTPVVLFHSRSDMKVDLGLLFVSICVVQLLLEVISKGRKQADWETENEVQSLSKKIGSWAGAPLELQLLLLAGLLSGFAFSIKYTGLFLIAAFLTTLLWAKGTALLALIPEGTGPGEDMTQYLGYEPGLIRFLTLPYDAFMNTNVMGQHADLGLVIIVVLPFLALWKYRRYEFSALIGLALLSLLVLSIFSLERAPSGGFDRMPLLLAELGLTLGGFIRALHDILIFIGGQFDWLHEGLSQMGAFSTLFLLAFAGILIFFLATGGGRRNRQERSALTVFVSSYLFLWLILGFGMVWYGLLGFILLYLISFWSARELIAGHGLWGQLGVVLALGIIIIWASAGLLFRMTGDRPGEGKNDLTLDNPLFTLYKVGKIDYEDVLKGLNPAYPEAIAELNSQTRKPSFIGAGPLSAISLIGMTAGCWTIIKWIC